MAWVRTFLAVSAGLLLVAVGFSESRVLDVDLVLVAPPTMVASQPQALRTLALTRLEAPEGATVVRAPSDVIALASGREIARARLRIGPDGSATGRIVLPPGTRGSVELVARAPSLGDDATTSTTIRVERHASWPAPVQRPSQPTQARAAASGNARVVVAAESGALVPPLASRLFFCAQDEVGELRLEPSSTLRLSATKLRVAPGAVAAVQATLEGVDATLAIRAARHAPDAGASAPDADATALATVRLPVAIAALLPEVRATSLRVRSFRPPRALTIDAFGAHGWFDAWSVRARGTETSVSIARLSGRAARLSVRTSPTLLGADAADVLVGDRSRLPRGLRPVAPEVERCLAGSSAEQADAMRDASALSGLVPLAPITHGAPARSAMLERSKRTIRLAAVLGLVLLGLAVGGLAARAAWNAQIQATALLADEETAPSTRRVGARQLVEIGAYVATAAFGFVALAMLIAVLG